MYLDQQQVVSDAQALSVTGGVSTNAIDLGNPNPNRNVGDGEPIGFAVGVDVAADFTTMNETYQIDVVDADATDLTTGVEVLATFVLLSTQLTLGQLWFLPIPPGRVTKQFLGLSYVLAGTTPLVTLTAWLTAQKLFQRQESYAIGYVVGS